MTSMWARWARQSRLTGLTYLALAAVSIAAAALLYLTEQRELAGLLGGASIPLIVAAIVMFAVATKYARLGR